MRIRGAALPAAALLVAVVLVAACGDGSDGSSTPTVVFGTGEVPATVPEDFPVPNGAVIGTTLVDGINTRTEFEMRVRQEQADVAQFYTVNLVNTGYVVDDSRLEDGKWTITFRRNALRGEIAITIPAPAVSQIVVEMNTA